MEEEDREKFDHEWQQANSNLKFLQRHENYLKDLGNRRNMGIGYEPSRPEHRIRQLPDSKYSRKH